MRTHNETLSVVAVCVSYLGIIASIVACIQMRKEEYTA
jgi:hypothetical protein